MNKVCNKCNIEKEETLENFYNATLLNQDLDLFVKNVMLSIEKTIKRIMINGSKIIRIGIRIEKENSEHVKIST